MGGNPVIPFPCGGPGQPACPPVECIAGINPQHVANIHAYGQECFDAGRAHERSLPTAADLDAVATEQQAAQDTAENAS